MKGKRDRACSIPLYLWLKKRDRSVVPLHPDGAGTGAPPLQIRLGVVFFWERARGHRPYKSGWGWYFFGGGHGGAAPTNSVGGGIFFGAGTGAPPLQIRLGVVFFWERARGHRPYKSGWGWYFFRCKGSSSHAMGLLRIY